MMEQRELEKLADDFLDLWQENIRLWSVEKELLPLKDLLELVSPTNANDAEAPDD